MANGQREDGNPLVGKRALHRPPERHPDTKSEDGADERDHYGLRTDHPAHLLPGHPDRPQQPQFTDAFVDGQGQGVHDAEQRDDHRERQQPTDQAEDLVDLRDLLLLELALIADINIGVALQDGGDVLLHLRGVGPGRDLHEHHEVQLLGDVRLEGRQRDHVVVQQAVLREHAHNLEMLHARSREGRAQRVPHLQMLRKRGAVRHDDRPVGGQVRDST